MEGASLFGVGSGDDFWACRCFFRVVAFDPGLKGSWDLGVTKLVAVFGDREHCC